MARVCQRSFWRQSHHPAHALGVLGLALLLSGCNCTSGSLLSCTNSTSTSDSSDSSAILSSIAVSPSSSQAAAGTSVELTATATYSDGSQQDVTNQVSWASSDTAVAAIGNTSGSRGLAIALATGSTILSATWGSVSGSATLTVTSATLVSIALTPPNPSIATGTSEQFTATGIFSDYSIQDLTDQVTWSSSSTAVASISNAAGSQGLASSAAVGSSTISATMGGISGSTALTVTGATLVSIAVTPTNPSIAKGTTEQFTATGTYSDGSTQNLTTEANWSSSNTAVASISNAAGSQGLASSAAVGSSTISATMGGISGSTALTVTGATLVSIAVTPTNPSIAKGTTEQFTATGVFSNYSTQDLTDQVTWSSSNTAVASISDAAGSQGLASSSATGSTTVTAASGSIAGSTALTVTAATLVSITVTPVDPTISNGDSEQFLATGTYSDGSTQDLSTQVTWASSDTSVATISNASGSAGLASSAAAGSTTISAASGAISGSTALSVNAVYSIGGTISGLSYGGLVITDDGGNATSIGSGATSFSFSTSIANGDSYSVAISSQPTEDTCTVSNGSGTVTGTVNTVSISCSTDTYSIGGSISGLSASGLVLTDNGGNATAIISGATAFTFSNQIAYDSGYAVTVDAQPLGQTCTVSNGSGTVLGTVNNVSISCSTNTYSLGGSISGLSQSGLVLTDNGGNALSVSSGASSFAFSNQLAYGSTYSVAISTQPTGELCSVANGSGTITGTVSTVSISCVLSYTLGGTISGLNVGSVVLASGSATVTVAGGSSTWVFPSSLASGSAYSVYVQTQPAGQTCQVTANASGTLTSNVNNVTVACAFGLWTWEGGSSSTAAGGVYGNQGSAAPNNWPGGREGSATWIDGAGNVWLFGGYGNASTGGSSNEGYLNDLWKYSPSSGEWTWESGSSSINQTGTYGTEGVAAASNTPGGRDRAMYWIDSAGNFWLFGGSGYAASGGSGSLNDLWEYTPSSGEWTWISGSSNINATGVYGTKGVAAAGNVPGARTLAAAWIDSADNLWLFGGVGYNSSSSGDLSDLWKYSASSGDWTWVAGSSNLNTTGTYGTQGLAAASNAPGARGEGESWIDGSGNLWMFGGLGYGASGGSGDLNDVWMYSPGTGDWTWQAGAKTINNAGVYGTEGVASAGNMPGGRWLTSPSSMLDASGNAWLFAGSGDDSTGSSGWLNDLWKYNLSSGEWSWVSGATLVGQSGSYGTEGVASISNVPGARQEPIMWFDSSGNLWMFGGSINAGGSGPANDLWKFTQP